jgi:hypothetical protein
MAFVIYLYPITIHTVGHLDYTLVSIISFPAFETAPQVNAWVLALSTDHSAPGHTRVARSRWDDVIPPLCSLKEWDREKLILFQKTEKEEVFTIRLLYTLEYYSEDFLWERLRCQ